MFEFFAGLLLFFIGLDGAKKGLKKLTAFKVKLYLKKLNQNIIFSLTTGIIVTSLLQSSSALLIILIGLLDAEFLDLKSAVLIMLGANIGTTMTIQLFSLPVLSSYNYIIITGLIIIMLGFFNNSYNNLKKIGFVIFCFGLVFCGLNYMTVFFSKPLIKKFIYKIMTGYDPDLLFSLLVGVVITSIIQSSSMVTGIVVTLAYNQIITLPVAVAIALGSNIGTCITGFLAGVKSTTKAKKLVLINFLVNLFGVIFILPFFNLFIYLISLTAKTLTHQIANAHTIFNIINILVVLPFIESAISYLQEKQ